MQKGLLKTPLHHCHLQLGARMVPFAGYEMPVQYTGVLEETKRVREACGLFDVSHMGQVVLRGKHALQAIEALVTNDIAKTQLGQAQYNMLCNPEGGVIDDLVIYRRKEDEIYICVNASNRSTDVAWMQDHLPKDVSFIDESDATALIALQGPKAEELLSTIAPSEVVTELKYYWATETTLAGFKCFLSRTGYTGEDGFEIYTDSKNGAELWNRLLDDGRKFGISPIGLGARDTLRTEMGYPLHGHELSPTITPLEAGLNWVVKLQRTTPFIGQTALQKQAATGPARLLQAFIVEDRRIARPGYRICLSDKTQIGEITSGTMSPHLNAPIALGFVKRDFTPQTEQQIEIREALVKARVVKLPFVPSKAKKNPIKISAIAP